MPSIESLLDAVICAFLGACHTLCQEQHVISCYLSEHYKKGPSRVTGKPQNYHCNRGFAIKEINPAVLKKMFQVDITVFDKLLEIITIHLVQRMPICSLPFAGTAIPSAWYDHWDGNGVEALPSSVMSQRESDAHHSWFDCIIASQLPNCCWEPTAIPLTYDAWDCVAVFFFDDTSTAMVLAFPGRDFHAKLINH